MLSQIFSSPRGTADILPSETPLWRETESRARQILDVYGYREIRTPLFEETELFARSMGQTSDVVQKQMLTLASAPKETASEDKKDSLSLRPEGTASVVRAYIQHHFEQKEWLSKFFYIGPMFRGERPQKGRLRQFHQIGVEAIGPGTSLPLLDAEVISLSVQLLKGFGLNDFTLKINTLGTMSDKEEFSRQLTDALASQREHLCPDCQQRFERNVFRILDCKNKSCQHVVAQIKIGHAYLSDESQRHYNDVKAALEKLGVPFVEDLNLVRGLDYYTHTVFEITASSLGSQDAVGAGGRYNHLISQLGGPEADAVGFALGLERIFLATSQERVLSEPSVMAFVIALDDKAYQKAFEITHTLRLEGIASDMSYRLGSVKSQMRLADKMKARFVVILGEDELKSHEASVKDMASGTQTKVPFKEVGRFLKEK